MPNRAALERAADKMSADGVIFNNVYDNGYSNNQVIFSLRDNLKNSTMTHKPTGKIVTPTENNPYPKIGTATIVNGKFEPTGDIFGEILPYKNSKITVGDITTENVGMLNGKPVIFDPEAAYNKDIIRVSNAKFKNKNN